MIHGMGCRERPYADFCSLHFPEQCYLLELIFVGDRPDRFVQIGERVIQKLNDVCLALNRLRSLFFPRINRWLLLQNGSAEYVVDRSDMLHLLREGADTLELAVTWREGILIFGHSVRCPNEFTFDDLQDRIDGFSWRL